MDDKTLTKIALVGSLVGIIGLFFLSQNLSVDESTIIQLDEMIEGEEVKLSGIVLNAQDRENVMYLSVAQEKVDEIDVVLFKDGKVDIKKGDIINVRGSLEEYNGEKQIVGSKVEVKS